MLNIRKILYKSFDSTLSDEEDNKLKQKLLFSKKFQKDKSKIEKLRIILATLKTNRFSTEFETNLLNKLRSANYPQIFLYRELKFAFNKFLFAALIIITFLVVFNFGTYGKIKIPGKEKIKLGEVINSSYFYSVEDTKGDHNGL